MLFVVGLGNPGREYAGTRHNVGFEVVDLLALRYGFPRFRSFEGAQISRGQVKGKEVLLVKPTTFMNLSGDAVGAAVRYFGGDLAGVVVIHDDLDFEPGRVRVKVGGGHGGHKGLRSVIAHLGREFVRVRVGIGKGPAAVEGADWVLSRFDGATRRVMDEAIEEAARAVEVLADEGAAKAMNLFNRRRPGEPEEPEETGDDEADGSGD